jgi:hypothetical protein
VDFKAYGLNEERGLKACAAGILLHWCLRFLLRGVDLYRSSASSTSWLGSYETLGAALELGESLGATLGEALGAAVGPKPKVQVSCCVIVALMRSTRVLVSKLPTREEPASISTVVAPKMMPCINAFAPM